MAGERAMAIFKEDLSGEIEVAKAAAQRMSVIAVVMGKAAAKAQLLPYVIEKVRDPETPDEILFRLAEQLDIAQLIGGFDPLLVAPLEVLCQTEETLVRDAACKSVISLVKQSSPSEAKDYWVPMVLRLCADVNWFTARVSAAKVLPFVYAGCETAPDAEETLISLRELLASKLVLDEAPMVKRAAAASLGDFASACKAKTLIAAELRPLFRQLLLAPAGGAPESDAVRIAAVGALPSYAALTADSTEALCGLVELCDTLSKDKSWKVRVALGNVLGPIAKAALSKGGRADFVAIFDNLQRDPEPEVRIVAANVALAMAEASSPADVAQTIVPSLLGLVTDPSYRTPQERAALGSLLVQLIAHVDAGSEAAARIVTEVGALLSSADENQFVRIQLIESCPTLIAAVGHTSPAGRELLAKLLKFIESPAGTAAEAASRAAVVAAAAAAGNGDAPTAGSNPKWCWRLRYVATEVVGCDEFLALGLDLYREHLAPIVRHALVDSCALVRACALSVAAKWAAKYAGHGGAHGQWSDENYVSVLSGLRSSNDKQLAKAYGHRLTTIYGLEVAAGFLSTDGLAVLAGIVADKDAACETPNVRIAVARCFGRLSQSLDFQGSAAENTVTTTLQKLANDADVDVKKMAAAGLANERLPLTFTTWGPTGAPWIPVK
mmetsp:Transcript_16792/g.42868  ORF Transcript_16792/g.42868 Transcript_16792/m.42868 type:complete len:667 (-) Transcript_16792:286-2286(-)